MIVVGLDLGQSSDFTALAVVESVDEELHLRHLERYPLHTPYTTIAENVSRLMRDPRLMKERKQESLTELRERMPYADAVARFNSNITPLRPELIVDATGVGKAVVDMLKDRRLAFRAVTLHGGEKEHFADGSYRVPKKNLVAALEVPFHNGTLKVAEGLPLWPTLREELLNFRRKINLKTAHESYEHWRDSDHDDLVLATALSCWWTRRHGRKPPPMAVAASPLDEDQRMFGVGSGPLGGMREPHSPSGWRF
jgi:hypothetical protein